MSNIIRSFRLYNKKGDMIDLLENRDIFGYNPEGLGVSIDNEYISSGSNHILSETRPDVGQFRLQILFGAISGDPYKHYGELVKLLNYPPYSLEYITSDGTWTRDCRLNEFTKSEMNTFGVMSEEFVLDLTSPWYKNVELSSIIEESQDGDGKIYRKDKEAVSSEPTQMYEYDKYYPNIYGVYQRKEFKDISAFTYDYVYEGWHNENDGTFVLDNQSIYMQENMLSPAEITIFGPSKNPRWDVVSNDGKVQSDGYLVDIKDGFKLVVSSQSGKQKAVLVGPDGTESNMYQQQMLELTNFVRIPIGRVRVVFFNCKRVRIRYKEERVLV